MPDIVCKHLLRVGQVWEKINGKPNVNWDEELGQLVIITGISSNYIWYRYGDHETTKRSFYDFEGRFKLVIDIC